MITRTLKGLRSALVAVAALGWWMGANAQNTLAGTQINNRATVSYSVGSLVQTPIESSPLNSPWNCSTTASVSLLNATRSRAFSASSVPKGVSETSPWTLFNNFPPTAFSNSCTCELTVGWRRDRCSAACEKLFSSATQ